MALQVIEHGADGRQLLGVFIRDLRPELFLKSHNKLNEIQRVRFQVLAESCLGSYLLGLDAEQKIVASLP